MQDQDIEKINRLLSNAENQIAEARELLFGKQIRVKAKTLDHDENGQVIEGVFNGETMVDSQGQEYPVAANYASKSKLIPGDILKLTIAENGTFIFKQIGPVERKNLIGILEEDNDQYFVAVGKDRYKVLLASITYFKAENGDKMTIIVPANEPSEYAAVENVIKTS
jgi:hypothetical protein